VKYDAFPFDIVAARVAEGRQAQRGDLGTAAFS
jgi:hypothetical protein